MSEKKKTGALVNSEFIKAVYPELTECAKLASNPMILLEDATTLIYQQRAELLRLRAIIEGLECKAWGIGDGFTEYECKCQICKAKSEAKQQAKEG